jgi:hypothetical protein
MLLGALAIVSVVFVLIALTARWAAKTMQRHIEEKLHTLESIVNEQTIPSAWLAPYRKRLDAIHRRGGSEKELMGLGQEMQQKFTAQIDDLLRYFQGGSFTDSPATRDLLLEELRRRRRRWAAAEWQFFVEKL